MQYAKDQFLESLARCREIDGFIEAFYDRLLASDEAIRLKFRFTDWESQHKKLDEALQLCGDAVSGTPEGLAKLTEIGHSHDYLHRDIHPEWYPMWLESIVTTAADTDPRWSPEVEEAWRTVLGIVTKRIASFYDA